MLTRNKKIWQYLMKLAETDKLPHAILVSGVSAQEFILRIFGGEIIKRPHPDFLRVEPADKEIQIAQIRDCIWRMSLKPSIAVLKVAVIDQAHLLNQEAQSALLKQLEEPRGKSLLVLITNYPDALFPTILSRVQIVKFFPEKKEQSDNKKLLQEVDKLTRADLAERFQYAEKVSKTLEIKEILTTWLHFFRRDLIKNKVLLQKIQLAYYLISKTNVNPRLTLETLMLEFR